MSTAPGAIPLLGVKPHEWEQVRAILREQLPGKRVWAFGSRATGRVLKRFSDLDLAVEGQLTWRERAHVSDAFEESLLPFKVDVVELDMVDADFRERIAKDFVVLQGGDDEAGGPRREPEPTVQQRVTEDRPTPRR